MVERAGTIPREPQQTSAGRITRGGLYAKPWFSVQAVACTEITSFPYTPSDLDPPSSKFGLNHPQTAGIRKRVAFGTPASLAAIRSAFLLKADQTLTAAACLQMTQAV